MNEKINSTSTPEQLNEAFEMTKLRRRYKKYINMMQKMLKDFKESDNGVNIVKTFGMNSGLTNGILSFFGFGKNAENRKGEIAIGVKPFTKNVLTNIQNNYDNSRKQFNDLVSKTNIKDDATKAKAINAASGILYQFFDEYMNASKLLNQGGIDIASARTTDAQSFKTYNALINSYNPKRVGNDIKQFKKMSDSYEDMVKKFNTLGQRLTVNFAKYFNKELQKSGKDSEKIANALEGTQAKLSTSWKNQTDVIKNDFPSVVQVITSSPEYTKYYEFIIKEVIPKVDEFINTKVASSSADANGSGDSQETSQDGGNAYSQDNRFDNDTNDNSNTPASNDEIQAFKADIDDIDAFVFTVPDSVSDSVNLEYDKDTVLTEASKSSSTFINIKTKDNNVLYKFKTGIDKVVKFFNSNGVKMTPATINKSELDVNTLNEKPALSGAAANKQIKTVIDYIKGASKASTADASTGAQDSSASAIDLSNSDAKQQVDKGLSDAQETATTAVKSGDSDLVKAGKTLAYHATNMVNQIKKGVTNVAANVFKAIVDKTNQIKDYISSKKNSKSSPEEENKEGAQDNTVDASAIENEPNATLSSESVYVKYSLDNINESQEIDVRHTYILIEHCWDNGTYIDPENHLVSDLRSLIRESNTIDDIARSVKNNHYLSLHEYSDMHKLNTYGASNDSFTASNPMCTATVFLYESDGNITGGKYLGFKKILF